VSELLISTALGTCFGRFRCKPGGHKLNAHLWLLTSSFSRKEHSDSTWGTWPRAPGFAARFLSLCSPLWDVGSPNYPSIRNLILTVEQDLLKAVVSQPASGQILSRFAPHSPRHRAHGSLDLATRSRLSNDIRPDDNCSIVDESSSTCCRVRNGSARPESAIKPGKHESPTNTRADDDCTIISPNARSIPCRSLLLSKSRGEGCLTVRVEVTFLSRHSLRRPVLAALSNAQPDPDLYYRTRFPGKATVQSSERRLRLPSRPRGRRRSEQKPTLASI
jgi:hypothetical protein